MGADAARFDRLILHTFPGGSKKAQEIWAERPSNELNPRIVQAFKTDGDCGVLAETLARKAVATSFVGAFAGAFATGELLRALHGGVRCEYVHAQLRDLDMPRVALLKENYQNRVARSGYCLAMPGNLSQQLETSLKPTNIDQQTAGPENRRDCICPAEMQFLLPTEVESQ